MEEPPLSTAPTQSDIAVRAPAPGGVLAMTTGRHFDPAPKSDWRVLAARLNALLDEEPGFQPDAMVFMNQVHGTAVATVDSDVEGLHKVMATDALVTARRGVLLVARTADCLPICLADPGAGVCAVVHSGWKGTLGNIVAHTVEAMVRLGARPADTWMWIGPAVCGAAYEVSRELAGQFAEAYPAAGAVQGRHLDLPALATHQAIGAGLPPGNIHDSALCTCSMPDLFHSHRRQGFDRGQQLTLCGLFP